MRVKLKKEDIEIIEHLFDREYPDEVDPKYFYYILYLRNHPFLKNPHLIIDDRITLYATERRGGLNGESDFLVLQKKYSRKNLFKLLKLLVQSNKFYNPLNK